MEAREPSKPWIRKELVELAGTLPGRRLALVTAPGGSGKTTLARTWREALSADRLRVAWLSVSDLHEDVGLFLEDLVEALAEALPEPSRAEGFGEGVTRLLPNAEDLRPERLVREISRTLRAAAPEDERWVLFLDSFERIPREGPSGRLVDGLLRDDRIPLSVVITTRGSRPDAATLLAAEGDAIEVGVEQLSLRTDQIAKVLEEHGVAGHGELVAQMLARTEGWPIAVRLAARALAQTPSEDHATFVQELGRQPDLFRYIGSEVLGHAPPSLLPVLEMAAVLGPVSRDLLLEATEAGGAGTVDQAVDAGLLVADGARVSLHELWAQWLRERMLERVGAAERIAIHDRAAKVLEAAGHGARALQVALDAGPGLEERIEWLLVRHGEAWVTQGNRRLPQQALERLSPERLDTVPALLAMQGLLLAGRDPDRSIAALKAAAEAHAASGDDRASFSCLHELAVIALNENRQHEVRDVYRKALRLRRVVGDVALRGSVVMALGAGSMLAGRYRVSLRLLDLADTYEHHPRERAGVAIVRTVILAHQGEWEEAARRIEALLERPEQRTHGHSFYVLQSLVASSRFAIGEKQEWARATLEDAAEYFGRIHHTFNELRTRYSLGAVLRALNEPDAAAQAFERAAALARRTALWDAEAAALGLLARLQQARGETAEARETAREALESIERAGGWATRWGSSFYWAPGVAMAAVAAAELGDAERAEAALDAARNRRRYRDLPVTVHTLEIASARIAQSRGDARAVRECLTRAWSTVERAGLSHFAPEIDDELLRWAGVSAPAEVAGDYRAQVLGRLGVGRPPALRIRSLGGLAFERDGKRLPERSWRGATPKRLLARLLAAEGRPLSREQIESELWPDAAPARARNSLRVALSRLRDALEPRRRKPAPEPLIASEGGRVGLTAAARDAWDVSIWRRAIGEAGAALEEGNEAHALEALGRAAALASGPFLPESYDDWVLDARRSLEEELGREGRSLSTTALEGGMHRAAERAARLVLASLPDDEKSWELVVRACLAAGDRPGARRALDEARDQLRRHLEAEPGPALTALAEEVATGR